MKDIIILIPAYNPNQEIMKDFILELKKSVNNIVVINDGSRDEYNSFFNYIESLGIDYIKHSKNLGKGRALKTAFNYILAKYPDAKGCVTCDCDGQHLVKDIIRVSKKISNNTLILGTRDFNKDNVPLRSSFGNKMTSFIFKYLIGLKINDTQTGLRGFSRDLMLSFLDTPGERFEYETKMLIECKQKNIDLEEVIIDTVYIDDNSESHFNPIKDSFKIYKLFSKYILSFVLIIILIISLLVLIGRLL